MNYTAVRLLNSMPFHFTLEGAKRLTTTRRRIAPSPGYTARPSLQFDNPNIGTWRTMALYPELTIPVRSE